MVRLNKTGKKIKHDPRKGGCGCATCAGLSKSFLMGGGRRSQRNKRNKPSRRGGAFTNTLLGLPAQNYYSLNSQNNDPNYIGIASRQTGNFRTGGRGRGRTQRRGRGRNGPTKKGGGIMSAGVSALNNATSVMMVGPSSYSANSNFFQSGQPMYSELNPPPKS